MSLKYQIVYLLLGIWMSCVGCGVVNSAPRSNYEPLTGNGVTLSPIIFIPGKGGSQIEARVNKDSPSEINPDCPIKDDWRRVWLDVWQFLWPGTIDCWAENMMLQYDPDTRTTYTTPGVEFRIPGFGETYSVEYVDDSWMAFMLYNIGGYFTHVMEYLEPWGYIRNKTVHGAPYDFRFAPHSQQEYFNKLQDLVEKTYRQNGNTKVTLLAHSMGGIHGVYFLHTMSQSWKDTYINALVPVNTPWKGTVIMSNLFTSGNIMGVAPLYQDTIRWLQRTWETGVLLLPQHDAWDAGHVIVQTPQRNYTAHDYDDYFRDVGYPLGQELYDNIQHDSYDMGNPGVDVYCAYSYGLDTAVTLVYEEGEFPNGNPSLTMGPGDGTVNLRSLEFCKNWLDQNDYPDHVAEVKAIEGVPHIDLLFDEEFIEYFKTIIQL